MRNFLNRKETYTNLNLGVILLGAFALGAILF